MIEDASGKRHPRSWTDEEIGAIAAAATEFPPISEDHLTRAVARDAARMRDDPAAAARLRRGR